VKEYVGGYTDWLRQRHELSVTPAARESPAAGAAAAAPLPPSAGAPRKKRSFKEQRELERLPVVIESLEAETAAVHAAMAEPGYFRQPGDLPARDQARLRDLESRLAEAFARWETLEGGDG